MPKYYSKYYYYKMPPKIVDATVIILDMGKNCAVPEFDGGKSFFDRAKACVIRIIERKIISRPDDCVSLVLLGSKKTNNVLAQQSDDCYRHINVKWDLLKPEWQMLSKLPQHPSNYDGDWLESLIVAFEMLENGVSGLKSPNKKIVLLTNFKTEAIGDGEKFMKGFQQSNIELNIIGPDLTKLDDDEVKTSNINLATQFLDVSNGVSVTFDDAMQYLLFHRNKAIRLSAWNVDLQIGPNIKIPVSVYGRTRNETSKIKWKAAVKDPVTGHSSSNIGLMKKETFTRTDDNVEMEKVDIIKGYRYGESLIPLSEDDKKCLYDPGPKCFSVYGFANASDINWQCLADGGLSYVFGKTGNIDAINALKTLAACLSKMGLVGIARRVYNNGNAPKMFALFPIIDGEYVCLSMAPLCFKEDIKNMAFPSTNLKDYSCNDEQVDAFKQLIQAMDLTKINGEYCELFPVPETVNPAEQYILDCIAFRAANPGEPLPQPRDDIINLFKIPSEIEFNSRGPVKLIKELFRLTKVDKKKKRERRNVLQNSSDDVKNFIDENTVPKINISLSSISDDIIVNIGTQDPVNDFKVLMEKGGNIENLAVEMTEVIENLIYLNFDNDFSKSIEAMKCLRGVCLKQEPHIYNNWLQSLKKSLVERNRINLLDIFVKEHIDLIVNEENSKSEITLNDVSEQNEIFECNTIINSTELDIPTEIDNFFDDM